MLVYIILLVLSIGTNIFLLFKMNIKEVKKEEHKIERKEEDTRKKLRELDIEFQELMSYSESDARGDIYG